MNNTYDSFPQNKLIAFFFGSSIEAIIGLLFLLLIPSDIKNQWILGYSFPRVVLISIFLLFGSFSFWMVLDLRKKSTLVEKTWIRLESLPCVMPLILCLSIFTLLFVVLVTLNPAIRFGNWQAHLERLLPLIWYIGFLSFQIILLLRFKAAHCTWSTLKQFIKKQRSGIIIFSIITSLLSTLLGFILVTGVGAKGNWGLWVEAGVPLLAKQVFWILCAALAINVICEFQKDKKIKSKSLTWFVQHQDLWICGSIWLVAFLVWTQMPLKSNYFFPGPYAPNYEFYPYSDASTWDKNGQIALIGQGFANGYLGMDHLGLSAFLAMLHVIVGQDFSHIVTAQLFVFAAFTVFLYWLGKSFHSRYLGLFLAGLSIIHQVNTLASENILNLSHAKMLMTEFPTGLGLIILSLCLFLWARNQPEKNMGYMLPIGGLLAILLLLRFNMLGMPLAILAGIILILWRKWKQAVLASSLVLLSFIIVLSPWMVHSWQATGSPFFFMGKVSSVFDADFRSPPNAIPTPTSTPSASSQFLGHDQDSQLTASNEKGAKLSKTIIFADDTPGTSEVILNHFVHNFVTSFLILPVSPYFYDLEQIIFEVNPFWDRSSRGAWYGEITFLEGLFIFINLVIFSLGMSYAWKHWKLAGFVPFGVYVAFNFFLAVARTSGGRYIVPIEWIVILYYGLGVFQIGLCFINLLGIKLVRVKEDKEMARVNIKKGIFMVLPFFLFVLIMTIMDQSIPPRYESLTKSEVIDKIAAAGTLEGSEITIDELRTFIQSPDSVAYFGRNLYPRYYIGGEGEYSSSKTVYSHFTFPRIGFLLIGPFENKAVLLPLSSMPDYFPHAADTLVVGCVNQTIRKDSIDAYLVIVMNGNESMIYTRDPEVPLVCPFADPLDTFNN